MQRPVDAMPVVSANDLISDPRFLIQNTMWRFNEPGLRGLYCPSICCQCSKIPNKSQNQKEGITEAAPGSSVYLAEKKRIPQTTKNATLCKLQNEQPRDTQNV
jgi:hypothetical protein